MWWRSLVRMTARRYFAVVRRGETEVFRGLLEAVGRHPGPVQLIWDRRGTERRRARVTGCRERRLGARRGAPPPTWTSLGFFFAPYRDAVGC